MGKAVRPRAGQCTVGLVKKKINTTNFCGENPFLNQDFVYFWIHIFCLIATTQMNGVQVRGVHCDACDSATEA